MKNNIFQNARLKLTLYYMGIMAVILIAFSSVLLFTIESKIRQGFRDIVIVTEDDYDPAAHTNDEIEFAIYTIDGILLIIIGLSSYFLAGQTLRPIKEALDAQKKFSADASHDLRTPLAIMTTESEVALQNKSASANDLRTAIESNLEETKKMSRLVNDLLLISRGDNRANTYSFVEVDLHNFIENIIKKNLLQAEKKGLGIKICEYKKIIVSVDKDNIERAFNNIFQNAIKYTRRGEISFDMREKDRKVVANISDTGVGIDEKDLPHVFDRFYKAEHSRNDSSGSGLGLPIAKLIIENHKGNISISSEAGKGTTVSITLPIV